MNSVADQLDVMVLLPGILRTLEMIEKKASQRTSADERRERLREEENQEDERHGLLSRVINFVKQLSFPH